MALEKIFNQNSTPFFFYYLETVKEKTNELKNNLPAFEILYAVKANPNVKILEKLKELGTGADVASRGELKKVLDTGFDINKITFAGPGKTKEELEFAIKNRIAAINVESVDELKLIEDIASRLGLKANVCVRINQNNEISNAGIRMQGARQFGIDEEQLPEFFEVLKKLNHVSFKGIHIFSGSQILDYRGLIENFENIFKIALKVQEKYKINIQIINFGGGFGIPYFEGEKELDIKNLGFGLKKLIEKYKSYFSGTKFLVESGRYLVGECGNYVTKVLYKKKSKGKIFLIIDGGFNHVLLPSFNNGALFKKNFKISVLKDRDEDEKEVVTIAGPLCTPYDILAKDMELPIIKSGDLICIHNVGAYGYSYSPLEFLSHKKPKEIIKQL